MDLDSQVLGNTLSSRRGFVKRRTIRSRRGAPARHHRAV